MTRSSEKRTYSFITLSSYRFAANVCASIIPWICAYMYTCVLSQKFCTNMEHPTHSLWRPWAWAAIPCILAGVLALHLHHNSLTHTNLKVQPPLHVSGKLMSHQNLPLHTHPNTVNNGVSPVQGPSTAFTPMRGTMAPRRLAPLHSVRSTVQGVWEELHPKRWVDAALMALFAASGALAFHWWLGSKSSETLAIMTSSGVTNTSSSFDIPEVAGLDPSKFGSDPPLQGDFSEA